jgi:signal-transduction protein with cAMP-binding, CBS, and nucleotidyltransferase domain
MPAQSELKASRPRVDKRAILSAHPFFKGLGSELIDQVGSHAITRVVKAGTVIYAKGDPGDSLFAVITGTVQISVPSVEGKDTVFAQLAAGEIRRRDRLARRPTAQCRCGGRHRLRDDGDQPA